MQRKWTENMNITLTKNIFLRIHLDQFFVALTFSVIFHYLLAALICLLVLPTFP